MSTAMGLGFSRSGIYVVFIRIYVHQGKSMFFLKEGGFGAEFGFQNLAFFVSGGVEFP